MVGKTPDLEITKHLLKDVMDSSNTESISIDVIQKVIADNYQISVADLKGKNKISSTSSDFNLYITGAYRNSLYRSWK